MADGMMTGRDLSDLGVSDAVLHLNWTEERLYETAVRRGEGEVAKGGALVVKTGQHTGRSARDKFTVRDETTEDTVWWDFNASMSAEHFDALLADFTAHMGGRELFVQELFGGADQRHRDAAAAFVLAHGDARDDPDIDVVDPRRRARAVDAPELVPGRDGDPADGVVALEGHQARRPAATTGKFGHGRAAARVQRPLARQRSHLGIAQARIHAPAAPPPTAGKHRAQGIHQPRRQRTDVERRRRHDFHPIPRRSGRSPASERSRV